MNFIVEVNDEELDIEGLAEHFGCTFDRLRCFIRRRKRAAMSDEDILNAVIKTFGDPNRHNIPETAKLDIISKNTPFRVYADNKIMGKLEFAEWLGVKNIKHILDEARLKGESNEQILRDLLIQNNRSISDAFIVSEEFAEFPSHINEICIDEIFSVSKEFYEFIKTTINEPLYESYCSCLNSNLLSTTERLISILETKYLPPHADVTVVVTDIIKEFIAYIDFVKPIYKIYEKHIRFGLKQKLMKITM